MNIYEYSSFEVPSIYPQITRYFIVNVKLSAAVWNAVHVCSIKRHADLSNTS